MDAFILATTGQDPNKLPDKQYYKLGNAILYVEEVRARQLKNAFETALKDVLEKIL